MSDPTTDVRSRVNATQHIETTVLVVGAGPAGMTAALALARYGVDHMVVEKYPGTAHAPRAHIVNQRTVEIMRHLGVEEELVAISTPHQQMANRIWYTTLNRPEVLRQEIWGTEAHRHAHYVSASPCSMLNCPQTLFEPMLVDALRTAGTDVRFGEEFVSLQRTSDERYESVIRSRSTGAETIVTSTYVIGADGARSAVMDAVGLQLEGETGLFDAVNIWFRADLDPYFAHRPGVLASNVHPGPMPPLGLGTFITCTPFSEFVLVKFYDPAVEDLGDLGKEDAVRHIEAAVGEHVDGVEILGVSGWEVNALVATRFSTGGVFCLGDAVHRHPPSGGMGLNMSVADAFNLAWKIALVDRGLAGRGLLDTYDSERRPVDAVTVRRTVETLSDGVAFNVALGLEPGMSEAAGWSALDALHDPGPDGDRRRERVRDALSVADRQVNALNAELGYRYESGALVPDAVSHDAEAPAGHPWVEYRATTAPGARVAHARIERDRVPLSTIDLVDGLQFVLLTGRDGDRWSAAAAAVAAETGVDLQVVRMGVDVLDVYWEWAGRRDVGADGAVLVRPDRHVAWRTFSAPDDPEGALRDAMRAVLHPLDRQNAATP
ncbi:FAD-dependent monooxygenase [Rhodococcus fascians]|nr:FAD-dependent monooxygenase [Rhodococcus fascians]MBY3995188.1 FAD-dependent monooxygenase [Rhodococcus fascians]MBY4000492.1 FAD-dependent monooxygenase [Rhodococcus fascians]MBY4005520.1 FAD-dependent monooxygenase [Rhodococcus fascians]MBY4016353.1 FAD-dependent monooxygenase [Rhodococcus fascians]